MMNVFDIDNEEAKHLLDFYVKTAFGENASLSFLQCNKVLYLTIDGCHYFLIAYVNDIPVKYFTYENYENAPDPDWSRVLEDIVEYSTGNMHVSYLCNGRPLIPVNASAEELIINFELHRCDKAV